MRINRMNVARPSAGAGGGGIYYRVRDLFSTDLAAGSVNGSAATPGTGLRTVVDAENKLSISGLKLTFAGGKATPAWGDPAYYLPSLARANGRVLLANVIKATGGPNGCNIGFDTNQTLTAGAHSFHLLTTHIYAQSNGGSQDTDIGSLTYGVEYQLALVLRSLGAFWLIKGGTEFPSWTLLWLNNEYNHTPLFPTVTNNDCTFTISDLRVLDFKFPWNDDYGIATQRLAGARAEGDLFSHEPDCLIGWTVTTRVAGQQMYFRSQDATNYWRLDVAADGSIALQEVVAGTPTSRGTAAAGSIANGQRIGVVAFGSTIKVYANNALKITYTSAANFATATAGKLLALGTGGAISDIVSWPRTLGSGVNP